MRIVAFIFDPELTTAILRYLQYDGRIPYVMHDELLVTAKGVPSP